MKKSIQTFLIKKLPGLCQRKSAKPKPYGAEPVSVSVLMIMSLTNILLDGLGKTGVGTERVYGWD